ncbi:MAG: hypothetical protein ACSLE9_09295 [Burkholderiaceae bacterium]
MRTHQNRTPRRSAIGALAAVLLAVPAAARADEPSPWYIGASQAFTHDSNVYRIAGGPGDTYSTTSLLGGFDQPIGRQRLYANAQVGYSKYRDQNTLDNTSYAVTAGWDWATIEKLSGSVNVGANRSLAQFNGNSLQSSTERNTLKAEQLNAAVRWGGDGLISLFGNYGHSRVDYSSLQSLSSDSTSDSGSIGMNYRLGARTTVGAAVRVTHTDYPHGIAPAGAGSVDPAAYRSDSSRGRNLDLLADWRYSEQTGFSARLSWTRLDYSSSNRDFSGLTGSVSGTYAATAKLGFSATLSRDAGTNNSYLSYLDLGTGRQNVYVLDNNQTTDSVSLGASYAATAKIGVNAGFQYRRGDNGSGSASDNYRTATLGANYAVARSVQLACNLSRESRSAGVNSYDANVVGCSAQITLR